MPAWTLDRVTGAYQDSATGKHISAARVREAVEHNIAGAKVVSSVLARRLTEAPPRDREDALRRFEAAMLVLIAGLHLLASSLATAGLSGVSVEAERDLEAAIREQQGYLAAWTAELKDDGDLAKATALAGMLAAAGVAMGAVSNTRSRQEITRRAGSYMDSALMTYERQRQMSMKYLDFAEGRRVLRPGAEHCRGCEEKAGYGWVPIDEVVPLGHEECGQWCECDIEYRKFRIYAQ